MISCIKDIIKLTRVELPHYFNRPRLILDFLRLWILSTLDKHKDTELNKKTENDIVIESDIWANFSDIIDIYNRHLKPRYILDTYLIRQVASGWSAARYLAYTRKNFTAEHKDTIPADMRHHVEEVSDIISTSFYRLKKENVYQWLLPYQYGLTTVAENQKELKKILEDTVIVELGAGVGANAAVHARASKKGIFIYDIPPMLNIQNTVIDTIRTRKELANIRFFSDPHQLIKETENKDYIVISYWAFTEFPLALRETLEPLIKNAKLSFFASNPLFEGTDNFKYFEELGEKLGDKSVTFSPISWSPYKKHSYVTIR